MKYFILPTFFIFSLNAFAETSKPQELETRIVSDSIYKDKDGTVTLQGVYYRMNGVDCDGKVDSVCYANIIGNDMSANGACTKLGMHHMVTYTSSFEWTSCNYYTCNTPRRVELTFQGALFKYIPDGSGDSTQWIETLVCRDRNTP